VRSSVVAETCSPRLVDIGVRVGFSGSLEHLVDSRREIGKTSVRSVMLCSPACVVHASQLLLLDRLRSPERQARSVRGDRASARPMCGPGASSTPRSNRTLINTFQP
jgi:hypothetical protein